jgi:hypothetical protein
LSEETYYLWSAVVGGLTFVAAVVTLLYLRAYTRAARAQVEVSEATAKAAAETARIAAEQTKAAISQTESQRTPVLVLHTISLSGAASTRFGGRDVDTQPYLPDGAIGVVNIGNGPALNVRVDFYKTTPQGRMNVYGRSLAVIAPNAIVATECAKADLIDEPSFEAAYQSLSGHRYLTIQDLQPERGDGKALIRMTRFKEESH